MKKIKNPYIDGEGYNCFGCSPDNRDGLQMTFAEDGKDVVSHWEPRMNFGGYINILHGGIQAALMDEVASWCIQVKLKTAGVTTRMNTQFKKPVYMDRGHITLRAHIVENNRRLARVSVELSDAEGVICSTGDISYYIYPEELARQKMNYPGYDKFFD